MMRERLTQIWMTSGMNRAEEKTENVSAKA